MHPGNLQGIRALVVEDNHDFAQLVRDILEIQGCTVDVAHNAKSGLELASHVYPHIVFCDLGLPGGMNGLEFAKHLRQDAKLTHIPLIAITGYTSEVDRNAAVEAGFNMVFPKPFKFADLRKALATYVSLPGDQYDGDDFESR